jgi:hypothetical protein
MKNKIPAPEKTFTSRHFSEVAKVQYVRSKKDWKPDEPKTPEQREADWQDLIQELGYDK